MRHFQVENDREDQYTRCAVPNCGGYLTPADGASLLCWPSLSLLIGDLSDLFEHRGSDRGELMPTLVEEVTATARGQARIGGVELGVRVGSSDEARLPFNEFASTVLEHLRNTLATTVRLLWEENKPDRVPVCLFVAEPDGRAKVVTTGFRDSLACEDTVEAMAAWLVQRPAWLAEHEAAAELYESLMEAISSCWRAIDRPADRWYAGVCGEDGCTGEVYGKPEGAIARCRVCGLTWDMAERRAWLLQSAERVELTAAQLSQALPGLLERPLSPETIRTWHRESKLQAVSRTRQGWPRFRVGPVVTLALATPTRRRRRSVTPQGVETAQPLDSVAVSA